MSVVLFEDQKKLKYDIYQSWARHRNVLAVLPTGGGKSVVAADIIYDGYLSGMKQAMIAHRNELVSQLSTHVARRGIQHQIIGSTSTIAQIVRQHRTVFNGACFIAPNSKTAVIGVDTFVARREKLTAWSQQIDRWMGDEAHHFLRENKWGKCVECFPNAQGIGFTATPCRADGQGLGRGYEGVFDDMVLGLSMRQLIDAGRLSDYEIVCPRSDLAVNEKDVGASGDWSSKSLKQASKESKIVGDTVENYCQYAFGRKAIVFATDVETAGEIARKFNATGIPAASVSAETNPAVREKFIEEFKSGKMMVLVNVDLFDEGFDVPDCGVVIMARPTASLGKYRQMAGRVLRYAPNKVALIIDQVSNVIRHGLPDKHVFWTLARADKRGKQEKDPDDIPLTTCLNCKQPYERFHVVCPHCGEEKPLPSPRERTLEMVDGDLILLDREMLQRMRAAAVIEAPADVGARVAAVAGAIAGKSIMNKQIEKVGAHNELRAVIEQWAGVERAKGFHDREIHKKFFVLSGMDVLTALDGSRPRTEMESISQTVKGWYER